MEPEKEPAKRLVIRKIETGGSQQFTLAQASSGSCDDKTTEKQTVVIEPWTDKCKKEPANDPIQFSTITGANQAVFG